jgi:hypothetical protein
LLFVSACLGHEQEFARSLAVKAPADMVLRGGKIVTVDRDFSIRDAVAIKDGRFLAVGTERDMRPLVGPATRVIDLAGRTVIPGLIDSHIYATVAGLTWDAEVHWESARTLHDALGQIRDAVTARPQGSWIAVAGGWVPTQFAERRFPTRQDLDAIAPNHPVYVQYLDEGALLNSAALKALGLSPRSVDPAGGKLQRDPNTGELTGWLQGAAAWQMAYGKIPQPALDDARQSLRNCFRELNRLGVTSLGDVHTGRINFAHRRVLADMARARELSLRINFYIAAEPAMDEIERLKRLAAETKDLHQSDRFKFAGFMMSATEHGAGAAAAKERFRRALRFFTEGDYNFHVRVGEDHNARQLLDVIEQVNAAAPLARQRVIFADIEDATVETAERIKQLGGGISIQDRMVLTGERNVERWGWEKARNAPPLRDLIRSGISLSVGTGAFQSANYSPMLALWWLITGKTVAGSAIRNPGQNLTRAEALRLYTNGGAWSTFEEGRKGSIEPGKYADLAVLDADYLTVPEEQIRSLESLLTIVGGTIVYAAGPYRQTPGSKSGQSSK